jgi:uncharacterized repeat protein (TIGR04138 family)
MVDPLSEFWKFQDENRDEANAWPIQVIGDAFAMNLRDQLVRVIAQDPRYSLEAYGFVLESLQLARRTKLKDLAKQRGQIRVVTEPPRKGSAKKSGDPDTTGHVTGQELCFAARRLALRQYGFMSLFVLGEWGIRSTSDLGEIVYNMIATGVLNKTPSDQRSDFDAVFDFESAFRPPPEGFRLKVQD